MQMSTESRGCVKVRSRLVSRICASVIADDDANYWLKTTPISYQVGHSIRLLLLLLLIRLLCDKDAGDVENCRRQRQRSLSTVLTNSSRRRRRAGRHAGSRPVWSLRRDKVQLRVRAMQAEATVGTSAPATALSSVSETPAYRRSPGYRPRRQRLPRRGGREGRMERLRQRAGCSRRRMALFAPPTTPISGCSSSSNSSSRPGR